MKFSMKLIQSNLTLTRKKNSGEEEEVGNIAVHWTESVEIETGIWLLKRWPPDSQMNVYLVMMAGRDWMQTSGDRLVHLMEEIYTQH